MKLLKLQKMDSYHKSMDQGSSPSKFLPSGEFIWIHADSIRLIETGQGGSVITADINSGRGGSFNVVVETPEQIIELLKAVS